MRDHKSLTFGISLLLCAISFVLYDGALKSEFVNWDDPQYVTENQTVAQGVDLNGIAYAFTSFETSNWTPLTWLSLELDATLFGVAPRPFHRTNVILHALNAVLLFLALQRIFQSTGCAAIVGLFFAVHPLHVESVAWVSERKDVLSTTFLLISLIAYERYSAQPSFGRWLLVVSSMTLGLLAKSMLVTLPILLFLMDWWPLNRVQGFTHESRYPQRTIGTLVLEKLPLLILSLLAGVVTIVAQSHSNAVNSLDRIPFAIRVGNAVEAYGWYLWKTLIPANLCVFYEHPNGDLNWGWVIFSAATMMILTAVLLRNSAGQGHRWFGWGWFVISLLPVSGILQVGEQAYADRYTYIPHIGLFVLIVWEAESWRNRLKVAPGWGLATAVGIAACWSITTIGQVAIWHDSVSLWSQVLRLDPLCARANDALGLALLNQGKIDDADFYLRQALIKTTNPRTVCMVGWIYEQRGNWNEAADCYRWALRIAPDFPLAIKRLNEIRQPFFSEDVTLVNYRQTRSASATIEEGIAAARAGDMIGALRLFEAAIEIDPSDAHALNNAALVLLNLKRPDDAEAIQRRAIRLAPENPRFLANLAAILESNGDTRKALEIYREALHIRPNDLEFQSRLRYLELKLDQR